ncbi:MAG: hypothetical protein FWD16_06560, partial [Clostridia bacterium]|nr:hypothetical protein [Clostridia bacterium]
MLRDYSTVITLYVFLAAAVACGPAVAAHRKNRSVAMWWLLGIALPPVAILLAWYLEPLAEEKRLAARWGRVWSQPRTMLQPRRDWAFLPAVFAVFCLAAVILAFYSVNGKMVAEKRILIKNVWRLGFYFGSGA